MCYPAIAKATPFKEMKNSEQFLEWNKSRKVFGGRCFVGSKGRNSLKAKWPVQGHRGFMALAQPPCRDASGCSICGTDVFLPSSFLPFISSFP